VLALKVLRLRNETPRRRLGCKLGIPGENLLLRLAARRQLGEELNAQASAAANTGLSAQDLRLGEFDLQPLVASFRTREPLNVSKTSAQARLARRRRSGSISRT
jgi:hypothetical protein